MRRLPGIKLDGVALYLPPKLAPIAELDMRSPKYATEGSHASADFGETSARSSRNFANWIFASFQSYAPLSPAAVVDGVGNLSHTEREGERGRTARHASGTNLSPDVSSSWLEAPTLAKKSKVIRSNKKPANKKSKAG